MVEEDQWKGKSFDLSGHTTLQYFSATEVCTARFVDNVCQNQTLKKSSVQVVMFEVRPPHDLVHLRPMKNSNNSRFLKKFTLFIYNLSFKLTLSTTEPCKNGDLKGVASESENRQETVLF